MKDVIYLSPDSHKSLKAVSTIEVKNELEDLIKKLSDGHQAFSIKSTGGNAVLLSEAHYEQMIETLRFLATPDFLKNPQTPSKTDKK